MKQLIYKKIVPWLFFSLILFACSSEPDKEWDKYLADLEEWQMNRIKRLKGPNGWLNLAGLYWLEEGSNHLGSGQDNNIVFPESAPNYIGELLLENGTLIFKSGSGVGVKHHGIVVEEIEIKPDASGEPTILQLDSLAWFVIKRGDQYGIRLRDFNSPHIDELTSISMYPADPAWRIEATFKAFDSVQTLGIPNVLGYTENQNVYGVLEFKIGNKKYELTPLGKPPGIWLVFGDETSGLETYGGGRFMGVEKGHDSNTFILDFNKAYNPPCAFTTFATCPLPPRSNILNIEVTAGEKVPPLDLH